MHSPKRRASPVMLTMALVAAATCGAPPPPPDPAADRQAVVGLERDVALVLARDGFDAYAALFHPEYTNWSGGEGVLTRAEYLTAVRAWYDAGNRAVATEMRPVSVEILGDLALSRYVLREEFQDDTVFVGRFTSLARRHEGRWTLYRTSFSTVYRGPRDGAPGLPQ